MKRYLCILIAALTVISFQDFPAMAQSRNGNARTTQRETRPSPRSSGGASRSGSASRSSTSARRSSGSLNQKPQTSRNQPARSAGTVSGVSGRQGVPQAARQNSGTVRRVQPSSGQQLNSQPSQARRQVRPAENAAQPPRVQNPRPSSGAREPGATNAARQPGRTGNNVPSTTPGNVRPGQGHGGNNPGRPESGRPSAGSPGPQSRPPHSAAPRPVPQRHDSHRVPPHRRPPVHHDRPVRFWDPGYHYFGYRVTSLPARFVRRVFWGIPYYIVDDVYYRYYGGSYYVCRPPFGVVFTPAVSLVDAMCSFAFYADSWYSFSTINENAEIITSQNRIIAENNATIAAQNRTIAQQNETIANQNAAIAANSSSLNSDLAAESSRLADRLGLVQSYASVTGDYYYEDGIFFTKNSSGEYVTIVPPAGALVEKLPDDYRMVTLDGEEYYAVDDTVYRTTVIDGTPYFEVLGQMTGALAERYDV